MNIRLHPAVLATVLAAGAALFASGCSRTEPPAPTATPTAVVPAAPATTVGIEIDDTVVTTKVTAALLEKQDIRGRDIKVETRKGMVQLSGFVESQAQVDLAMAAARAVEGVKGVENGMNLKDGKVTMGNKVDDGVITAKVKSALLSDPGIKSFDIAAVTSKGVVQLSGFVDNQAQIDRAMGAARVVDGVTGVVNEMSIKK